MNIENRRLTGLKRFSGVSAMALMLRPTMAPPAGAAAAAGAEGEGSGEGEGGAGGAGGAGKKKPAGKEGEGAGGGGSGGGAGGSADDNKEGAAAGGKKKPAAGGKEGEGGGAGEGEGAGGEGDKAKITESREELITRLAGDDEVLRDHLEHVIADDEKWREEMAGGDAKLLERLKRFATRADVARSLLAAEGRLRERGAVSFPAAEASPEDWAAFSTANMGRPAKSEEVKVQPTLPEGEQLSEDEAGVLSGVVGLAWKSGRFGQAQFDALGQIVADMLVGGRKEVATRAKAKQTESRKTLEKAWGGGEANVERMLRTSNSYCAMRCEQVGVDPVALSSKLLADGTRLGDDPLFAQVMAAGGLDHAENPMMQPRDETAGGIGEMEKELKALREKMNSKDKKVRAEYDSEKDKGRRAHLATMISRGGGGDKGAGGKRADTAKLGK